MFERSLQDLYKYFQDREIRREAQSYTDTVYKIIDVIVKELKKRAYQKHILLLDNIKQIAKHTINVKELIILR